MHKIRSFLDPETSRNNVVYVAHAYHMHFWWNGWEKKYRMVSDNKTNLKGKVKKSTVSYTCKQDVGELKDSDKNGST